MFNNGKISSVFFRSQPLSNKKSLSKVMKKATKETEDLILSDIFFKPRAFCESELPCVQEHPESRVVETIY